MATRTHRSIRFGIAGLSVVTAAALSVPAVAGAEPTAPSTPETVAPATTTPGTDAPATTAPESAPGTTAPESTTPQSDGTTTLPTIPGDAQLADLLRKLKATGGDQQAVDAITAILSSDGQLDPSKYLGSAGVLDGIGLDKLGLSALGLTSPAAPAPAAATEPAQTPAADVLTVLQKATGTNLLTPAVSPLCADPTPDNPLGLSTAPALAVPGPWPTAAGKQNDVLTALSSLLPGGGKDLLTAIGDGQTAYALVPPSNPDSDQFQVAWFNTSTLKGGLAELKPLSESASAGPLKQLLADTENFHGVRLARVDTGKGTVLSAVFGTTTKAGRTCFFLPALGSVTN
ncbi:hypothetical protein [Gordonia neofelifaecis]|uniref:Uncharacterized protein n=1 Tax=Gordonia neofelifaecis NRRL B-59395 TaxID=644548 RepID=F1YEM8_9ACTN|nr:hypothetical protein [Gordonia neofelifaecis]EGD56861.1 hypothetical protein SCNU_00745 [Gordonia neofelifaecis NRRL B-59395]